MFIIRTGIISYRGWWDAVDSYGTLHAEDEPAGTGPFVVYFELLLAAPADEVWQALTEADGLNRWFPQDVQVDLEPGGKMRFSYPKGQPDENGAFFEGRVLEVGHERAFAFDWGTDVLRCELRPSRDGCLLIFTDTFAELGKAARDAAGWHVCLEALEAYLDETAPPPAGRWEQVYPGYVERFGPEAAAIGPPAGR
jgi:uncharacterized protein YndB with AHSA1/START domain